MKKLLPPAGKEVPGTVCGGTGNEVKDRGSHKEAGVKGPDREKILAALQAIPADCPYDDWFHVAAALKNEGFDFEVFDAWSKTAPEKYDPEKARSVWDSAGNSIGKDPVTAGTIFYLKEKYAKSRIVVTEAPAEMLPVPETPEQLALQAARFIDTMYRIGENIERTEEAVQGKGGKWRPKREKKTICLGRAVQNEDGLKILQECSEGAQDHGIWIGINPLVATEQMKGKAPSDTDVTDHRYALLESDEGTIEEQWECIRKLKAPVKAVIHSGNKSLHTLVEIGAGNDPTLYRERVKTLYAYAKSIGLNPDPANKNSSRQTRLPGCKRGEKVQYLVSGPFGTDTWKDFETLYCEISQKASEASEKASETALDLFPLTEKDGPPYTVKNDSVSSINQSFFAAYFIRDAHPIFVSGQGFYLYETETGLWRQQTREQMIKAISESIFRFADKYKVPELVAKRDARLCKDILVFVEGKCKTDDPFSKRAGHFIHCRNGVLVWQEESQTFTLEAFSPDFHSRNRCEFDYDPAKECPRFLSELVNQAMTQEDAAVIQQYGGQILLGRNITQMLLILSGTAAGGKSTLVSLVEQVIGEENFCELRTKELECRFETSRFIGKTLLCGKDVRSTFLAQRGASAIKKLTGGDRMTTEAKCENGGFSLRGIFNIIITVNSSSVHIRLDNDYDAWRRRLLWIVYNRPSPSEPIHDFDQVLLREEGEGILAWFVEGAAMLLRQHGVIKRSPEHLERIDRMLTESDSILGFVQKCVVLDPGSTVTGEELSRAYERFCTEQQWEPLLGRPQCHALEEAMASIHHVVQRHDILRNGSAHRGYSGVRLKM